MFNNYIIRKRGISYEKENLFSNICPQCQCLQYVYLLCVLYEQRSGNDVCHVTTTEKGPGRHHNRDYCSCKAITVVDFT